MSYSFHYHTSGNRIRDGVIMPILRVADYLVFEDGATDLDISKFSPDDIRKALRTFADQSESDREDLRLHLSRAAAWIIRFIAECECLKEGGE